MVHDDGDIESPRDGDPLRTWRYVDPRTQTSLWWAVQARNKRLVTLNLKHPEGLSLAKRAEVPVAIASHGSTIKPRSPTYGLGRAIPW